MKTNNTPVTVAQINAFAMQYGLILGLYEIFVGGLFISSLEHPSTALFILLLMISVPILSFRLMRRFRNHVGEGKLSFGQGFQLGLLMYIYAGIILAIATYVYFAYFEQGAIANYYERPENVAALNNLQMGVTSDEIIQLIRSLTPKDYASNVLINNTFFGAVLSAISAVFIRK